MNINVYYQASKIAIKVLLMFSLITGIIYPGLVMFILQQLFPWEANGSLLEKQNRVVGSALIGQDFNEDKYFRGRVSRVSNLSARDPELLAMIQNRRLKWQDINKLTSVNNIPLDLVTASASGLDPHISIAGALYQAPQIAKVRNLELAKVQELIAKLTEKKWLSLFGEDRINVLLLNLALDELM